MSAYITGSAVTAFGKLPGRTALDWQVAAAREAVADEGRNMADVDALIAGYATTLGHLMPANLLAETLGIRPTIAFGMNVGGATGLAMLAQAAILVDSGTARRVLVVAGEDRASGQSRTESTRVLAQVGQYAYEVPLGGNVPAYYALLASRYHAAHALPEGALNSLPVQMRAHAIRTPGAQFRRGITEQDVAESRSVATPLNLLDCCPVSDGGAAFVVSAQPSSGRSIRILGHGQAHLHQHLCEVDLENTGAALAAQRVEQAAGVDIKTADIFGIYDSFSITLAMLVEELGLAPRGRSGESAAAGMFAVDGRYPMNTHGGLLSYGHSGVAGGLAHVAEVVKQLRHERTEYQVAGAATGYVHADGGILSAHVGMLLQKDDLS